MIDTEVKRRGRVGRVTDVAFSRRVVGFLMLVSIMAVMLLTWRQQQQADCNAKYNQRKAVADQARAQAAEADRRALEKMVRTIVEPPAGDAQAALDEYLRTLDETDRKRQQNPVPPPPPDLCR